MRNNISRLVIMFGNIFLEIKLAELLSLKQASNVCIVCHNNYFTCTLLSSDKIPAQAKMAGNGKSPEGTGEGGGWGGEGGFLGQTIWVGRYWWNWQYTNNRILQVFFHFLCFLY